MPHRLQMLDIAVVQWDVKTAAPAHNRAQAAALIETAATQGARLIVLPELCISGYHFASKEAARTLAEPPEGTTEQAWRKLAKQHDIAIVGGLAERRGEQLFNALVFITADGTLARYHKTHLFDLEKRLFTPGQQLGLVRWKGVQIGLMLCYDGWFPELPRALTLAGAELLLAPGCWHSRPPLMGDLLPAHALHLAAAYTNGVFIACASRGGREGNSTFAGNSAIFGPHGLVAGPAGATGDAIISATIDLRQARFKYRTKRVHPLKDRRPELYTALTLAHK